MINRYVTCAQSADFPAEMQEFFKNLFKNPTVIIKNKEKVTRDLERIIMEGAKMVHIVSDFDMTMTKYWLNGKRSPTSHGILNNSSAIHPEYKRKTDELYKKYYPIEVSTSMTREEKIPLMVEWWSKAHDLVLEYEIKQEDLRQMVIETPAHFRQGLEDVLLQCKEKEIPFMVFSAGLGDIIENILHHYELWYENMHMISNMMIFNEKGICIGFEEPLIHVFNKSEASVIKMADIATIKHRTNVILLGDSLGDLHMADGMEHGVKLTVGFLNHDKEKWMDAYSDAFDIVITDDSTFEVIQELLRCIKS